MNAPQAAPAASSLQSASEFSLLDLVNVLLRHRGLVLGLPCFAALVVTGVLLLLPRTYTASASFMPQSPEGGRSRLAGLAAQFGVGVPLIDQGQTPAFYADLLTSREILRSIVETKYTFSSGGVARSGTLVELYEVKGKTPDRRREAALRALKRRITANTETETSVVRFSVRARWPELAELMAQRLLDLVSEFNLERRQSQAAAERKFVEGRLAESRTELRAAQERLQTFLERNRDYRNSPLLTFDRDRLAQDISTLQSVYTSLAESFENARIDEVRNTPVVTIVESPEQPVLPDPRGFVIKGLLALTLAFLVGFAIAFSQEVIQKSREESPDDFSRFQALRSQALQDLRRPWRGLGRVLRLRREKGLAG
jgi:uncharacterized protein involved in exopolysaccharide biosynthesis